MPSVRRFPPPGRSTSRRPASSWPRRPRGQALAYVIPRMSGAALGGKLLTKDEAQPIGIVRSFSAAAIAHGTLPLVARLIRAVLRLTADADVL